MHGVRSVSRFCGFLIAAMALCAPKGFASTLSLVSGDGQSVRRAGDDMPGGSAMFKPLSVSLKDGTKPVAGARVDFTCKTPQGMVCTIFPVGRGGPYAVTDANGLATLNRLGGNSIDIVYASGKFQVVATAAGAQPVTFNLEAIDELPPPPAVANATMTILSGDGQKSPAMAQPTGIATAQFDALSVVVKANGKPLPGVRVSWTCDPPAKMKCQAQPSAASPTITLTDGNGVATLNKMRGKSITAYYAKAHAAIAMTASYGKASAVFHLTVGN
jgi:hypothetical protein